ncbi:MAG TPA: S41 family peptidase [Xanthobacteraceae bacterium]|nr:S41 family peptidase [Xanthobacteraceae bacterium]
MLRKVFPIFLGAIAGAAVTLVTPQPRIVVEASSAKAAAEALQQLSLFSHVFERVRSDYVEKPDDWKLIEAAIKGMLAGLDPHSRYLDARGFRDAQVDTLGKFGGLGLEIASESGRIKVISAIDETPAAQAGMIGGDIITRIDDEPVDGLNLSEVAEKLRGPANTKVKLTIRRQNNDKPMEMVITRAVVRVNPVRWHLEDEDLGYVRISQFNEQTISGLKKAINDFKAKKGDELKGFILDLRNNPGGLVDQAITVANAFLKQGEILSTRGRGADGTQRFIARAGKDISDGKPVIVLINGGSASASEIVAGALQDHKRATIIGTRSFGKGSLQTLIPLGRESGALSLTTARYFTPSGRSIQAKGISPDIIVQQEIPEELRSSADATSEAGLRGHLLAEGQEQTGSQSYVPPDLKHDKALKMARELIHGRVVNPPLPSKRDR